MQIQLELPEDIGRALQERWENLPRHTLENLTAEDYATGVLSESQVRRLLGLETRLQVHAFLHHRDVALKFSGQDLRDDLETLESLIAAGVRTA